MHEQELNILLDHLRGLPKENQWVEFKVNNMKPEGIGKRISAISNSACLHQQPYGYLIFGIEDMTGNIVGTQKHFGEQKKGNEELENWVIQRLRPKIDFRVYDFYRGVNKVSIIQIPSANNQPVKFMNESFIRIGSITRKLNEFPDKERKIWQNNPNETFESQIALAGIAPREINSILSFETYFELLGLPIPTRLDYMIDRFVEEKLIVRNGPRLSITNLGAILFAKDLGKFDALTRKSVRLIAYDGRDKTSTKKEYTGRRGYAVAFNPLLNFIDALIPTNEIIKKALRQEVKLYPEIALRELIANALIHQDFTLSGTSPMIEIYRDRIEISNPGKPIINPLRFIDHHPQSRNEKLAFFMRRLNFCEERGSGIDKVINACEVFQLPAPAFMDGGSYTRATLFAPKAWKQMNKLDKQRACYQHCSLKYVGGGDYMTNSSLRKRLNISEKNYTTASRIIYDSVKAGLIKDSDPNNKSKKHAKYIPFWAS
ncbi:MAG: ATP-binding protein [Bacteroidota bacterium]